MERSLLKSGDEVAVYLSDPVPRDPYASHHRQGVRRGVVSDPHHNQGVLVDWGEGASAQEVSARQVITHWGLWEARLAERDAASSGQRGEQLARLNEEMDALTSAQAEFPSATLQDGSIVIPIAAWLARGERP